MTRRPMLAGNWKMYKTTVEAVNLITALREGLRNCADRDIVVAPPMTALGAAALALQGSVIHLAAQNLHWEKEGAYTGEVSAEMLKDVGCHLVIIGHSERRQYFGETDSSVRQKTAAALRGGLMPIVCVGETLAEREAGQTFDVIKRQVTKGLEGFSSDDMSKIVIAYEPVWAIGTGKTASPEQAQEVHGKIREWVAAGWGKPVADGIRILYGGSVKPDNVATLMSQPDIDGGLVGGASLKAADFLAIIHFDQAVVKA